MNLPAEMHYMLSSLGVEGDDLSVLGPDLYVSCGDPENAFNLRDLVIERDEWECVIIAHPESGEPILKIKGIIQPDLI